MIVVLVPADDIQSFEPAVFHAPRQLRRKLVYETERVRAIANSRIAPAETDKVLISGIVGATRGVERQTIFERGRCETNLGPTTSSRRGSRTARHQYRTHAIGKIRHKGLKDVALQACQIATPKSFARQGDSLIEGQVPVTRNTGDFEIDILRNECHPRAPVVCGDSDTSGFARTKPVLIVEGDSC